MLDKYGKGSSNSLWYVCSPCSASANQSMNITSAANLSVVKIYTREGDETNAPVELKMFEEGDPLTLTFPAMVCYHECTVEIFFRVKFFIECVWNDSHFYFAKNHDTKNLCSGYCMIVNVLGG